MEEIKVGEYVRMINGLIAKIVTTDKDNHYILDRYYAGGRHLTEIEVKNDIVKHNHNIIDLVEVGDYVNGEQITDTYYGSRISSIKSNFNNEDIKSILTKEQFNANCYEVKE